MRIRTIKPELWTDEELASVSIEANLMAVGLLNYADDEGYFNANPNLIKASLFPLRDLTLTYPRPIDDESTTNRRRIDDESTIVRACLEELSNIGFVSLFSGGKNKAYGRVVNFEKHQRIDRKKPSKIKGKCRFDDESTIDRRLIDDESAPEQGTGNREQGVKRSSSGDDSGPATDEIQDDQAPKSANKTPSARQKTDWIMELWNDKADARLPRCSVWSAKRRGLAAARLCDHPDRADWEKAVAAVNASTFCTGQGPRGWLASIDWLLRPETLTRLIEGQFADGEGKARIEARHGQSSKNAGIGSDGPEIVKPSPKSAGFWRHPDDPEPGENDRGRSSEWGGLLESLAGDMEPDRFSLFEDELTTCEAISDSDIWLIVGGNYARAAMFAFRDEPLEICGRDLHVAIDDTEEYARNASLARLPY